MNSKFKIRNSKLDFLQGRFRGFVGIAVVCWVLLALQPTVAQTKSEEPRDDAPRVSGSIEPDSVGIGDRFTYTIEVEKDIAQGVFFPVIGGKDTHYELIGQPVVDTLSREGRKLKIRQRYTLAAFQEGRHGVVPQVMYADKNIIDTLSSDDTLRLLVTTFVIDSTSHSIFDIKPQKDMPFKFREISGYVKWSLIVLAIIIVLLYVAYRIMRHYGKSLSDIFHPAPPLPPHEVARLALERLYVQRLWQAEKHKLYYSSLTDILRTYIDGRFGVSAMEMTSDEIIEAMREVDLPQKSAMDLTQVLRDADLVKFAKAMPEAEENEAAYSAVWNFVEQTKPVEEVADEEDEKR
jgi:hypothetical protein